MKRNTKKPFVTPISNIICLDFDGCVCDEEFPGCGKCKPGVREALEILRKAGKRIHIYSCRSNRAIRRAEEAMIEFLDSNRIPYDQIETGYEGKPLCDIFIDDRAITYSDAKGWGTVLSEIMDWYEKQQARLEDKE